VPAGLLFALRKAGGLISVADLPRRDAMSHHPLRIVAAIVGVLVLLLAVTPFLVHANQFRPFIEERTSTALGRKVTLGNLKLSLSRRSLTAETLAIADDPNFSNAPFLSAKTVSVGVKLLPLILSRSLKVTGITLESPQVTLIRNAAGRWNYASLGPSFAAAGNVALKTLAWKNGKVIVASTNSQKRSIYDHVDVTAADVTLTTMFPMIATADLDGGGHVKLAGNLGPLNQTDASRTPLDARITVNGLNLAARGFLNPTVGLGGLLDLDATIASRNDEREIRGTAKISKALLVAGGSPSERPVTVDFNTKYNRLKNSGVLGPSTLRIGNATARLSGTYNGGRGEYSLVNIKIAGDHMPAADLESFLPGIGIHFPRGTSLAAGTVTADLIVSGPTNNLVTSGHIGLYGARLAGFNLGAQVRAISGFSGLETGSDLNVERMTTNLRVAQNGLRFDTFIAVVPAVGYLVGAGTIDARNNLDFKMVATVTAQLHGGMGGVVGTAGAIGDVIGAITGGGKSSNESRSQRIPFLVEGTTSDPRFVADTSGMVIPVLKNQLGNLNVPGLLSGKRGHSSNPLGALVDQFMKRTP
jgi:AsmA protein